MLVERGKPPGEGLWSLPGGKVERGESVVEAVVREVREETGISVAVGGLVDVVERIAPDYHYVILAHGARVTGGVLEAGSDVRAVRWVGEEELAGLPTTDGLGEVIRRAFGVAKAGTAG